jgi:outer membrane protein
MKRTVFIGAAGALALSAVATPAAAQTNADQQTGVRSGDVLLRVRAIMVAPNERSGSVLPAFPGEKVRVDNSFMPEVDATYMASDHVGFELIASTTKHHADGRTGTTGSIGRLASTWVLPPTLTAQYHFAPASHVRPYVGAGLNYTIF